MVSCDGIEYTSNLGSFSGHDPEVDFEKVREYVDWKRSLLRHPLYQWAKRYYWRRVDDRWFLIPWYRVLALTMRFTQCEDMRGSLNRIELIRAGLDLGQHVDVRKEMRDRRASMMEVRRV